MRVCGNPIFLCLSFARVSSPDNLPGQDYISNQYLSGKSVVVVFADLLLLTSHWIALASVFHGYSRILFPSVAVVFSSARAAHAAPILLGYRPQHPRYDGIARAIQLFAIIRNGFIILVILRVTEWLSFGDSSC